MAHPLLPKQEVIERLTAVFRREGFDGASLALLSKATGLGRSSLYHHFPRGKDDMAEAVLASLRDRFAALALAPLGETGPVRARLVATMRGLAEFYDEGSASCLIDLFSIGTAGEHFIPHLSRTIAGLQQAIAQILGETGMAPDLAKRRALDAVITVQGSLVVSRASKDPDIFRQALAELPDRLLA